MIGKPLARVAVPLAAALLALAPSAASAAPAALAADREQLPGRQLSGRQPAGQIPWTAAWTAAPQAPAHTDWYPNWSEAGFEDRTVRQVIRAGAAGSELRVRLSNAYGKTPLRLAGATVALSDGGAAVRPGTVRPLRFGGAGSAAVPAGGEMVSDPAALPIEAFGKLAVTLYFRAPTGPATFHNLALTGSYRAAGDHSADVSAAAFTEPPSPSWYYLAGVDVKGRPHGRGNTVVAFGDSLTDGYGSDFGADDRYPDVLAERLAAAGSPRTVVNAGIGGNKLLNGSGCFGESALARFRRDALDRTDVGTVVLLEGTNDIVQPDDPGRCTTPAPKVTAQEITAGLQQLIREARARGVRVIGATIPPYQGYAHWTERGERVRNEVNEWIRVSGAYDGVVDADRAVADGPRIREEFAFTDGIHLNSAGYRAVAEAVDLGRL
ncbi:SGNH/GDSL hydrolase family protein [Streptomyces sp. VNUA116]|uniref:SGNH/GDSL hydrolase family protein n=1 Tax=Streptomyces sp. VNUA116 TaxID=3062449 RepID=UPI002676B9FB|nr:SGNH/GDSL hydrolase family protein [Streptomyces sp. VNUA116]WKU48512.1 SGNH/GDSL hydrolase family protein [Streptomyces sp. VNUA116]